MDAVFEALAFGVRVTFWIFRQIYIGYGDTFRWLSARSQGETLPFPFLTLSISVFLTVALISFFIAVG